MDFSILLTQIKAKRGVELGVGRGDFSQHLLDTYPNFKFLYGVDRYLGVPRDTVSEEWRGNKTYDTDVENFDKAIETFKHGMHGTKEYHSALKRFSSVTNYILLRSSFTEAAEIFNDGFFDFVFIDGNAHEGQNNGKTFTEWWPKVRSGGIFSGRAYDTRKYSACVFAVDEFVSNNNLTLNILEEPLGQPEHDKLKNWYIIKP